MTVYLLDTNTISDLVRGHGEVVRRAAAKPISSMRMSVITEAEMLYGLAKRPDASRVHRSTQELRTRIDVVAWDSAAALHYGLLRANLERGGRNLAALDLLIAAHALSLGAILVSADKAFQRVEGLTVENWRDHRAR